MTTKPCGLLIRDKLDRGTRRHQRSGSSTCRVFKVWCIQIHLSLKKEIMYRLVALAKWTIKGEAEDRTCRVRKDYPRSDSKFYCTFWFWGNKVSCYPQASFELSTLLGLTFNSWSSCLHLSSSGIIRMCDAGIKPRASVMLGKHYQLSQTLPNIQHLCFYKSGVQKNKIKITITRLELTGIQTPASQH